MEIIEIIKERLSMFKNLYDSIRIVDPMNKKLIEIGQNNTQIVKGDCYEFCRKDGFCSNCIAMRSYLENDTFLKVEFIEGKLLLIISSPVTIDNNIYIVEMIKRISQTGSIINDEKITYNMENLIVEMNDKAIRDELTGIYNRRYINERLSLEIKDSLRFKKPLSVIMADLDFFKDVNDKYGHVVGDWVLKDFAKILSTTIRSGLDWVGRYGGEEFLIVLGNTDGNTAFNIVEKIRKLVEEKIFAYEGINIKITSSFGGYSIMNMDLTIDELINEADKNLYLAKKSGRNKTIFNK